MFRLGVFRGRSHGDTSQYTASCTGYYLIGSLRTGIPAAFLDSMHSVPCGFKDSLG